MNGVEHTFIVWVPPKGFPAVPLDQAVTELLNRYGAKGWQLAHYTQSDRLFYGPWTFAFTRPATSAEGDQP